MPFAPVIRESSVLIHKANWQTYVALRDEDENRHVRMTYDRGRLELLTPSMPHEELGYLIGRCIDVWTEEWRIPMRGCRSTTFRREDLERGLEPDDCYYIARAPDIREKRQVDLLIDPPPDLAVEVDVHSSSLDRMAIYAALRVPEVWRWSLDELTVRLLNSRGEYERCQDSAALPGFPFDRVRALLLSCPADATAAIRDFRLWVRMPPPPSRRDP